MAFLGARMLRHTSTTQGVVALSSGESQFYASVKAAQIGFGLIELLRDMGVLIEQPVHLRMDATAVIGVASRQGAGRIRHISTPTLWLQGAVMDGRVLLRKVPGPDNWAGIATKYVDANSLTKALKACGFVFLHGRSAIALKAST